MARDDFSEVTIRKLGERVNLLCSNPGCRAQTKGPHTSAEKALNLGLACHIRAASSEGPRYDPEQTPEERSSIENGIWLCTTCGPRVDKDEANFPVPLLRYWKAEAELEASESVGKPAGDRIAPSPRGSPWARCGNVYWLAYDTVTSILSVVQGVQETNIAGAIHHAEELPLEPYYAARLRALQGGLADPQGRLAAANDLMALAKEMGRVIQSKQPDFGKRDPWQQGKSSWG